MAGHSHSWHMTGQGGGWTTWACRTCDATKTQFGEKRLPGLPDQPPSALPPVTTTGGDPKMTDIPEGVPTADERSEALRAALKAADPAPRQADGARTPLCAACGRVQANVATPMLRVGELLFHDFGPCKVTATQASEALNVAIMSYGERDAADERATALRERERLPLQGSEDTELRNRLSAEAEESKRASDVAAMIADDTSLARHLARELAQLGSYHDPPMRYLLAEALRSLGWQDTHEAEVAGHNVPAVELHGVRYVEQSFLEEVIANGGTLFKDAEKMRAAIMEARLINDGLWKIVSALASGTRLAVERDDVDVPAHILTALTEWDVLQDHPARDAMAEWGRLRGQPDQGGDV